MKNFRGTLFLIGGSASDTLEKFVKLAGGAKATIVVLPHASGDPKGAADDTEESLKKWGAGRVVRIMPGTKDQPPSETTAIFMTGGDQSRLVKDLDAGVLAFAKKLLRQGGVVGGTSAGAAGATTRMIAGGLGDDWPLADSLVLAEGLGLLDGYIVDTHVHQRSRTDRLAVAMARTPAVGGIGLDEDTAVEIRRGTGYVHGKGLVRVYTRAANFSSPLEKAGGAKNVNVRNLVVSLLPAGERFKL